MRRQFLSGSLIVFTLALGACSSTPDATTVTDSTGLASTAGANANAVAQGTVNYFNVTVGDRVFFDTNRYDLDAKARETLQRQAAWLQANPGAKLTLEGHADERGTRDYNLALGDRRANAARSYLTSLGVNATRLHTVSYGKERPVALCSAPDCWAQNRRAVTVVAGVPAS